MKIFSAWFLAVSIIALGSLCNAQTMIDMKDEAGVKYKQADVEMNRTYKLATATCDRAGKEKKQTRGRNFFLTPCFLYW